MTIDSLTDTKEEHLRKCQDWVARIYYANIAMNNDEIRKVVDEISRYYYVTEGQRIEAEEKLGG